MSSDAGPRPRSARLVLQCSPRCADVGGLWWPHERFLAVELPSLVASWPIVEGHIVGVSYARWDWDDHPDLVEIPRRRGLLRTRTLPPTAAHTIALTMLDGSRTSLVVVAPEATDDAVAGAFERLAFASPRPGWAPRVGRTSRIPRP